MDMNAKNMNYKTTIAAAVSAAASFVLFAQTAHYVNFPQWALGLSAFLQIGGLAAFGVVAKDYNVTGGSVGQTEEAKKRVNNGGVNG